MFCIFIFGFSWIRSFGMNKHSIGIAPKYRSAESLNFSVIDVSLPLFNKIGGFLISIAFIHFIPEIYAKHSESIGVWILVGFLVQLVLEYFSGGIEHGHMHPSKNGNIPIVLFISLSIHSILEGIPLEAEFHPELISSHLHDHDGHHHHSHGSVQSLLFGVIFHNIPVAIALTTLLLKSGWKKWSTLLILFAFSMTAPIGIFIGHELIINKISIEAQLGYYAYQPFKKDIAIYDRVGMKYRLSDKLFVGFSLKTHLFLAEALEIGIGYRI